MSSTAGDPNPISIPYSGGNVYYCPHCNQYHNANGIAYSIDWNRDNEIIEMLKKILDKLEEIRMEI